ncbi:MAG: tetratricopeptide repeat protein [Thiohalomonadales bacterium]
MTDKKSAISTVFQNPLSIALMIFTIVIVLIWMDYRSILKEQPVSVSSPSGMDTQGFALTPPNLGQPATQQPKILDTLGGNTSNAPGLDGLISGLEAKVKSDPRDVGKRILLAQTYKELGMIDKSLTALRQMIQEFPAEDRVKLVMASVLSHRQEPKELKEALTILDGLTKSKSEDIKQYLVQMYQGDAYIRLKNPDSALEKWNLALKSMPNQDNRYQILQQRIAKLNSKESNEKEMTTQGG